MYLDMDDRYPTHIAGDAHMTTWSEGMSIFNGCTDLFHHSQLDRYVNRDIDSCRLPIQEDGVNFESQRLMPHEVVSEIRSDRCPVLQVNAGLLRHATLVCADRSR